MWQPICYSMFDATRDKDREIPIKPDINDLTPSDGQTKGHLMRTNCRGFYECGRRRLEAITLLTTWVRQLRPFGFPPPLVLAAQLSADAIDRANELTELYETDPHGQLPSGLWEFHTRAYLLAMLADFYSIVDTIVKTLGPTHNGLRPQQLRKVLTCSPVSAQS
jgi:hypothetical protein